VSEKLRTIRKKNGLTQAELARRVGVSRSYINKIENGEAKPSLSLLERIASILDVSIKDFF
jgi:putative transcriptional regulator